MEIIIAEKPKAAYRIASSLGSAKRIRMGKVSVYKVNSSYVVPAVGHLFVLAEKKPSSSYPVFDVEWKPIYEVNKKAYYTKPYIAVLKRMLEKASSVVVACDFDTEGSLIGYNVYRFLSPSSLPITRMKFSSLTKPELLSSYKHQLEMDINNALAGEVRHYIDWYYGINLSRALMSSIRAANNYRILSIGRVQGPTLAIVAEREKEIEQFVPEKYYLLYIIIKGIKLFYSKGKLKTREQGTSLLSRVGNKAKISIKKERKAFPPYPPFDLTSLQIEAAKHFSFSPSKTLKIAQSLYENGYISYPRTSSQKLPFSIGFRRIIESLGKIKKYSSLSALVLKREKLIPVQGKKEDEAHPAIYPTGNYGELNEEEEKLYDLIVKRFLALFSPFAEKEVIEITAETPLLFSAKREVLKKEGWIKIYSPYFKKSFSEPISLEEEEKIEEKGIEEKETEPPKRYTPSSLLSELEKRKLGTKATRAVIIDTLYKRYYIAKRSITLTPFGKAIYEVLKKYVPKILDEEMTRRLEEDMEKVRKEEIKPSQVLEEGKAYLIEVLKEFKENEEKIGKELLKKLKESYSTFRTKKKKSKKLKTKKKKRKTKK